MPAQDISSRKHACDAAALSRAAGSAVPAAGHLNGGAVKRIAELEPKLDILVNNAGAAWGAPFDEFPESGWDKVLDLNLKSPFFLTQALHGVAQGGGDAREAVEGDQHRLDRRHPAQSAGDLFLPRLEVGPDLSDPEDGFAKLIEDNIVVSCIAPGAFASEMNRLARDHGDEIAQRIPSRRIGEDEDMAAAAIYLASRAGDYVVGATIPVDGGVALAECGGL